VEIETLEQLEEKYVDQHDLLDFRKLKIGSHHDDKKVTIKIPDKL